MIVIFLVGICSGVVGQCPNDICEDAIMIPEQTPTDFCNYECEEDFSISWGPEWNFWDYPCSYPDYDMWFSFTTINGGMVEFYFDSDYTHEDSTVIGNHGPLEGLQVDIYQGGSCEELSFLFGTQCYWMTDEEYCCFDPYDPTRQQWHFVLELPPQTQFYVNVDGWGDSVGCGEWWWSEPFFLWDDRPVNPEAESWNQPEEDDPILYFTDLTGRKIKPAPGVLMIAKTKYGKARKIIYR